MIEIILTVKYMAIACLLIALMICLYSLIRFRSILVKLVVIEVIINIVTSGLALWSLLNHQAVFLDICVALVLVMFLSTVAYCQFILPRGKPHA